MTVQEAPQAAKTQAITWTLVVLLGALTILPPMSVDMYLPALPSIGHEFGASPGATRATLGAFLAGLGIGQFFYGPISDRIGRRPPLIFGYGLYIAASIACIFTRSIEMLILVRFFQAMGACAGQVIPRASVRDRFDHQSAARVLSMLMLVTGLGPIIAPILGSALINHGGWRVMFAVQAAIGGCVGVWMLFRFDESHPPEAAAHSRGESVVTSYLTLLRQPRLIGFMLATGFNSAALFGYISSAPSLLIDIYHVAPANFGWVFALNAVGLTAASQLNAHLLRWHTPEKVLMRSRLISVGFGVALVVGAYTGLFGMFGVLVPLFLVVASFGLVTSNTMAAALNIDPRRAGAISSLLGGATFGCGAIVSVITGLFHDGTPRPLAIIILVCMLASTASLFGVARPTSARPSGKM